MKYEILYIFRTIRFQSPANIWTITNHNKIWCHSKRQKKKNTDITQPPDVHFPHSSTSWVQKASFPPIDHLHSVRSDFCQLFIQIQALPEFRRIHVPNHVHQTIVGDLCTICNKCILHLYYYSISLACPKRDLNK